MGLQTGRCSRVGRFAREIGGGYIRLHNLQCCRLPRRELLARIVNGILRACLRYAVHHCRGVVCAKARRLSSILSVFRLVWHRILLYGSGEGRSRLLIIATVSSRTP